MPSISTDRLAGLSTSVAVKAPVKAVATSNITLSGEQTVNGVALVAGNRCLVTAQTSSVDNGIYDVAAGAWSRSPDFDGSRDVVRGTLVLVNSAAGIGQWYQMTSSDPVVIGTDAITFTLRSSPNVTYDLTPLETLNGLTSNDVDTSYEPGNARRYGAVGDGLTGEDAAFARMKLACAVTAGSSAGIKAHGEPGDVYYLSTATASLRNCHADFRDCKILLAAGTTAMLTVGGRSTQALNPTQQFGQVIRTGGKTATPTLRVIGCKGGRVDVENCDYMQYYADSDDAAGDSTAYSKFFLGKIDDLELNTNPSPLGSTVQWINENEFHLSRVGTFLMDGTYPHNKNDFFGGCFEETSGSDFDFQVGYSNTFYGIRLEGNGHTANFEAGTWDNEIELGWSSNQRIGFEPPSLWANLAITDAGESNRITSRATKSQERNPLVVINASTCRAYTSNNGSVSYSFTDNVTSLRGVDLQRLGVDTFQRQNNRGIFRSELIPVEVGDALEIEADVARFRHHIYLYDSDRVLLTEADGADTMMRTDGNLAWSNTPDRYQQNSDVARSIISVKDATVAFIRFEIVSGSTSAGIAIRWINAWLISAKRRTSKLAGIGVANKLAGASAAPTLGFAPKGELVSDTAGGYFQCTFSLDTAITGGGETTNATVIDITGIGAAGALAGDVCGIVLDDGTTHWAIVSSVGANDFTIPATGIPSAAAAGSRVVFSRWLANGYRVATFTSTDATPSVLNGGRFLTAGTTTITDFDDGVLGQTITIMATDSIQITHNASIIALAGAANFSMTANDTLTLTMFVDQIWTEVARSVN